jgi:hypothetical protein
LVAQIEEPDSTPITPFEPTQMQSSFQIYSDPEVDEVDVVAQQEQLELQEWAEFLAQTNMATGEARPEHHDNHSQMTDYDDDEYDSVFMELIDRKPAPQNHHQHQPQHQQPHGDTEMDLSS